MTRRGGLEISSRSIYTTQLSCPERAYIHTSEREAWLYNAIEETDGVARERDFERKGPVSHGK